MDQIKVRATIILLLLAPTVELAAQSIDSLVAFALASHPEQQSVAYRVAAVEERSDGMRAWDPPRIGARISMLPPTNPNPFSAGQTTLVAEQSIPLFGSRHREAEAELAMVEVEESRLPILERELRREIGETYYRAWSARELALVSRESRALLEKLYEEAERRTTLSRESSGTLYRLATEIARLDLAVENHTADLHEAIVHINILAGRPLNLPITLVEPVEIVDSLPSFQNLAKQLADHPDLLRLEQAAVARERRAEGIDARLEPTLTLGAGLSLMPGGHPVRTGSLGTQVAEINAGEEPGGTILGLSLGGTLSIPTAAWSRSGPEGRAEAEIYTARALRADRSSLLRRMSARLHHLHGEVERSQRMLTFYREKQIPLLEQQIAVERSAYVVGEADLADLIESWRTLLTVREEVLHRRAEKATQILEIEVMTGQEVIR